MSIFGSIMGAIFGQGSAAPLGQTVDVAAIVDKAAAAKGEKLAWRTSIVDLMKALRRKSHPEGPGDRAAAALGRRASHARRDRSSIGPQRPRRTGDCGPAGHHPGLVPQAGAATTRWLEGASKPRPASGQASG